MGRTPPIRISDGVHERLLEQLLLQWRRQGKKVWLPVSNHLEVTLLLNVASQNRIGWDAGVVVYCPDVLALGWC